MKKLFLFFILAALFTNISYARIKIPTPESYQSGRDLCEKNKSTNIPNEKGFFIGVPIDYSNPSKGTTDIYAHFPGGFDVKKKTILFFTGGPGQTAHWGLFRSEMPYNVLIMENRGIGCSRPEHLSLYLDSSFYSSEFVARDAAIVLKALRIPSVIVYGISYGTATGTIFASLYPELTQSVILEGVLFAGGNTLWSSAHRRELLQNMINELPHEIKTRLEEVHSKYKVPDTWFSKIAKQYMLYSQGVEKLRNELLSFSDEATFKDDIKKYQKMYSPLEVEPHPLFVSNEIPYFMISCQELGLDQTEVKAFDSLSKNTLVPTADPESVATCKQLKAKTKKLYLATDHPLIVPVTYFQGADDGATPVEGAIQHYNNVPKGFKQFFLLEHGGHNPNLEAINGNSELQKDLFNLAIDSKGALTENLSGELYRPSTRLLTEMAHESFNGDFNVPFNKSITEVLNEINKHQELQWIYYKAPNQIRKDYR